MNTTEQDLLMAVRKWRRLANYDRMGGLACIVAGLLLYTSHTSLVLPYVLLGIALLALIGFGVHVQLNLARARRHGQREAQLS